MAQSRGKSRGMVNVALGAVLAATGALLGAAGCSSEVTEGSGGAEHLGQMQQGQVVVCGKVSCPPNPPCGEYVCKLYTCVLDTYPDGNKCVGADKEIGSCASGECCTGCTRPNPETRELDCFKPDKNNCGISGGACDTCSDKLCATGVCTEKGVCDVEPLEDKDPCTDNSGLCLGGSCCRGCINDDGQCVAGNTVNECGRTTPQSGFVDCVNCDQGNSCSNYACTNGVCAAPTPKPGTCNDNTVCNGTETCGGNQCNPGTPLNCSDNDPCTNNGCNAMNGCTVTPNTGASCSDNNLCTVTDACAAGTCTGSGAPNCDDNNPCTIDSCDPQQGCVHTDAPNNDPCSDGNACSTGDRCFGGECLSTGGLPCDDDNPCTLNSCNPAENVCVFPNEDNGTPCVHTNKCVQNSTCQAGACNAGPAIVCDDANPCTADSCDPAVGCVFTEDDTLPCSDGDACTTDDACDSGECEGTPVACAALDECHVPGTCNPLSGKCDDPRADDGTECNEGGPGTCDEGKCVLLPIGGAGNEGGAPGAGGQSAVEGGAPTASGGQTEPGSGGSGEPVGSAGGPEPGEEEPRAFVREPGGCSCRVPSSSRGGQAALWLAGLAMAAAVMRRRRPAPRG